mmetsp:Transcript_27790/g.81298  ORF Transcript_27790/g.81298 Transcript_27790/m.81298 type:complete len:209 (-) Transcript_27790:32-658(-)
MDVFDVFPKVLHGISQVADLAVELVLLALDVLHLPGQIRGHLLHVSPELVHGPSDGLEAVAHIVNHIGQVLPSDVLGLPEEEKGHPPDPEDSNEKGRTALAALAPAVRHNGHSRRGRALQSIHLVHEGLQRHFGGFRAHQIQHPFQKGLGLGNKIVDTGPCQHGNADLGVSCDDPTRPKQSHRQVDRRRNQQYSGDAKQRRRRGHREH